MQTITINVLAATKNRDQVLETKVNGIRHTRLRCAQTEGAGVDAKHFAEAIFCADNRYKVGKLVSNVPTCGKRIVRTVVYEVLTVVTATPTTEPTTACELLEKALREYGEMQDERNEALRAKWRADETLRAANNKLEDAQCRIDAAHQRLADASAESLHEMPAYLQIMIAQRLGR